MIETVWLLVALLTLPNGTLEIRLEFETRKACQAKAASVRRIYQVGQREWLTKAHLEGGTLQVACHEVNQ